MHNFIHLTRRELLSAFVSPLAYGTGAIFLFIFGASFYVRFNSTRLVEVSTVLDPLGHLLPILLAPVLTMRLISEERRLGTLEMLLTAPVSDFEVALSKFVGILIFYAAMIGLTLAHVITMRCYYQGGIDWGSFFTGYLGALLVAGQFLAFGLFVSSFFETPILGALISFIGGLAVLTVSTTVSSTLFYSGSLTHEVFRWLMPNEHYKNFMRGIVASGDLVYFGLFIGFFLFLTTKVLESRKWK